MAKPRQVYDSEAAMCADFCTWARQQGWVPYAETAGWDILLVGSDGTQIGVHAKLKFNMQVLGQVVHSFYDEVHGSTGEPDFRAVLTPDRDYTAAEIAGALGLQHFFPSQFNRGLFSPDLSGKDRYSDARWHFWNPAKRCKLPEYIPDVAAGSPAPVQLTEWKIKALRICATLESRGKVTRDDFKRHHIDIRRWIGPQGWLVPGANPGEFVFGSSCMLREQHPVVYAQIRADIAKELIPTK